MAHAEALCELGCLLIVDCPAALRVGRRPFVLSTSTTMTYWFGLDRSCQSGDLLLLRCGEGHTVHTAGLCRVLRAHTLANPAKARQPLPLVS